MGVLAMTAGEIVLWGSATAVAALLMAGMANRRRAHLTDVLRGHVRRQQGVAGDGADAAEDEKRAGT